MHQAVRQDIPPGRSAPAVRLGVLLAGSIIAAGVTALMYNTTWIWSLLVVTGLVVFVAMFAVKDLERYWLWLFLFCMAFEIRKMLLDGFAVKEQLGLGGDVAFLVPDVRLSDLTLVPLVALWVARVCLGRTRIRFPLSIFFFFAYVFWVFLASLGARHPYLSGVQLYQEIRGAFIFLYVANNLDLKRWMPVVKNALLVVLLLEGGLTFLRYRFQYFKLIGGDAFGRMTIDTMTSTELLIEAGVGSAYRPTGRKRGFGTIASPAGTSKQLMLLLPMAMFWILRGRRGLPRVVYVALFLIGMLGLFATFSRAGLLGFGVEVCLFVWLGSRLGFIRPRTFHMLVIGLVATVGIASPVIYVYLRTRPSNVSIRLTQFEGTLRMIVANPILGVGINNGPGSIADYTASTTGPATTPTKVVYLQPIHSYFLALAAEAGLIGAAFLLGFFGSVVRLGFKLVRSPDPDVGFYSAIAVVSIIGLGVQIAFDPLVDVPVIMLLWFFCGCIPGLARFSPPSPAKQAAAALTPDLSLA
jgi:hypothetical protein